MRLGPHTLIVVRAATRQSDYGTTQVLDWSSATRTTVDGCSVQPGEQPEFTQDRDSVMTVWVAYLPIGTDIGARDRVEWNSQTYDIDGDVLRWDFGALSHLVVNLRRSDG